MKRQDKGEKQPTNESPSRTKRGANRKALENEHKRMQAALQESEELHQTLYEESPIAYFSAGVDGRVKMANRRARELLGYTLDELLGRPVFDLYADTPAGKAKAQAVFQRFVAGEEIRDEELEMQATDGRHVWVSLSVQPIRDKEGKVMASRWIVSDITERKLLEERIQRLNLTLQAIRNVNQLIVREKNRDRLLQGICRNLTEIRGFYNAWTALFDESGGFVTATEAGLGPDFLPMIRRLKSSELPHCVQKALKQGDILVIRDPTSTCTDCPLSSRHCSQGAAAVRLEHSDKVFGLLVVSTPTDFVTNQAEHSLLQELAGDISLALHSMELEAKRQQAEEDLRRSEQDLAIRNQIANIFLAIRDDTMYGEVLQVILERMESKYGVFGYLDEHGDLVCPSMTRDIWDQCQIPDKDILFPRDTWRGIWGRALIEKKTLYSNEPLPVPEGHIPIRRVLIVPITYEGEVTGILTVANKPTNYDEKDIQVLETIANHIAPILNARLQRNREERARQQAEELFRTVCDSSPIGIYITQEGKFQYVNPQFEHLLGYSESEVLGTDSTSYVLPADRDVVRSNAIAMLKGKHVYPYEYRVVNKAGDIRHVMETVTSILYQGKRAVLGSYMDITERKQLEKEMVEYKALNKFKSDLLSTVSHELRTPLAIIKGYSTMLVDYDQKLSPEEKREYLRATDSATDRLSELVDRLLDMSRLDAGLLKLEMVDTSILKLIRDAVAEAKLRAPDHKIVANVGQRLPRVAADARRIRQVLDNLIDNACKYSAKGTEVTVSARRSGRKLLISVTDHGIGIPASELQRVFDRMYRIEQRLSTKAVGMGLGLAICKGLIEAHGGRIWMESEEGKGSTCFFTLPLHTRVKRHYGEKGVRQGLFPL